MSEKSRPVVRTSISLFLSFCVTLLGTIAVLLGIILSTICNPHYILYVYEKSGYFERLEKEIREQYIDIGIPGGVSESFFDEAIDEPGLHEDITTLITASFNGETYTIPIERQHSFLYNQLAKYAQAEKSLTLTEELTENLLHLTDLCMEIYTESIANPFIIQIGNLANRYSPYIEIGLVIICFLILVSIIFLFLIHRRKDVPPRYLQFTTISIGIILLIPSCIALLNGFMDRINISLPSLFYFVNVYITNILTTILYIGLGIGIIGTGILAGICYLLHKRYCTKT